jgi:hypothetical protein
MMNILKEIKHKIIKSEKFIVLNDLRELIIKKNKELKEKGFDDFYPHCLRYEENNFFKSDCLFKTNQIDIPILDDFPLFSIMPYLFNIVCQNNQMYFKCRYSTYENDEYTKHIFLYSMKCYLHRCPYGFGYIILYYLQFAKESQIIYMKYIYNIWIRELEKN